MRVQFNVNFLFFSYEFFSYFFIIDTFLSFININKEKQLKFKYFPAFILSENSVSIAKRKKNQTSQKLR
jgi:hypothetical protein